MKLGVNTTLNHARALAAAGVDYVEELVPHFLLPANGDDDFASGFSAQVEALAASPLPVPAANCFLPASLKCVGPDADLPAVVRYAATAFRRAERVGLRTIGFGSGGSRSIPEGWTHAAAEEQFVATLQALAPLAAARGVTIAVETLHRGECNFINTNEECARVVRACGHPAVRLLADLWHLLMENEPPAVLRAHGDLLHHVHLAERGGRMAPGTHGEDFRPWLRVFADVGYRGDVTLECSWESFPAQVADSVAYFRNQAAEFGF